MCAQLDTPTELQTLKPQNARQPLCFWFGFRQLQNGFNEISDADGFKLQALHHPIRVKQMKHPGPQFDVYGGTVSNWTEANKDGPRAYGTCSLWLRAPHGCAPSVTKYPPRDAVNCPARVREGYMSPQSLKFFVWFQRTALRRMPEYGCGAAHFAR